MAPVHKVAQSELMAMGSEMHYDPGSRVILTATIRDMWAMPMVSSIRNKSATHELNNHGLLEGITMDD